MVVLKPTISTNFRAFDGDSVPHISTMRFIIHDANYASECCRDIAGVAAALGLSLRHLLVLTSTAKLKTEKGVYQPWRKNLDCTHEFPSYAFLEISICLNDYIVKITIFTYDVRLGCSIVFNNDALLLPLSANAVTIM